MGNISGKVYGGGAGVGVGGAVTILLMYVLKQMLGIDPPPEVDQAVTTILGFAGALYGGYLAPHTDGNHQPPAPPVGP